MDHADLPDRPALFLDFDGTLVEIAATPDAVAVAPGLTATLARLAERLGGALAVVSGRPVAAIDGFLAPLHLPVSGLHGLETRYAPGAPVERAAPVPNMVALRGALAREPFPHGVLVEDKDVTIAVHYRLAPHAEDLVRRRIATLTAGADDLAVLHGKMVVEVKPRGASKGTAVAALMAAPPFAGRVPVFVGDDVTDEDGFAGAEALGGFGIKVGPGPTRARERLPSVTAVQGWLAGLAKRD